jgi:glycosyltransferase involved in cell wall biosynthesis
VRGARQFLPVIVVNDGSSDDTAAILREEGACDPFECITFPENRGKAAALRAGFARAEELRFTHVVTMDADGQHPVEAIPQFAARAAQHPDSLIVGTRDLKQAQAPRERRWSNALCAFWFKLETGVGLPDTQCGFRVYPLDAIRRLHVKADRYAYELEVMVKAAWAGVPLVRQPVQADYAAPTSNLSHFDPMRDFLRIARAHARLITQAVWSKWFEAGPSARNILQSPVRESSRP